MKKVTPNRKRPMTACVLFLLITLLLLGTLAGCTPAPAKPSIKIGVITYRSDDTFINTLSERLTAGIRRRETEQKITITLNIVSADNNQNRQNTLVDRMLRQDYDVLCVNMVDRTTSSLIIDRCKDAGVPVIFFNREPVQEDMLSWEQLYYVGTTAIDSGRLQGQILLDLVTDDMPGVDWNKDGRIQYVMLEGEPGHQDSLLRTDASIRVLTEAGYEMDKLASDTANWELPRATQIMLSWLDRFYESGYSEVPEVVFANNEDMALGAIRALEARATTLPHYPIVLGIDATPTGLAAIQAGTMYGTVVNDARMQAAAIADLAVVLASGETPSADKVQYLDGQYVRVPHRIVTKKTVANEIRRFNDVP